jgi:thioesterase domain-containing protein
MIDLKRFEAECRLDIPLLNAMQLSFVSFEDLFGGSIASICLFGGWAVSTLAFIDNDIHNTEIVVFKNDMTFERPARGLLRVNAWIKPEDFETCLARLKAGDPSRMRLDIHVDLFHDDDRCATMHGLYVVWLK